MPASCAVCGQPIWRIQPGWESVCPRPECHLVASHRSRMPAIAYERFLQDESRKIREQDRCCQAKAAARRIADEREAAENHARWRAWLAVAGDVRAADFPLLPVPHNGRRLIPLSQKRRRALRDWLREQIALVPDLPGDTEEDGGQPSVCAPGMERFLGAGCALCAGACCLRGGDKAYLKAASLLRVMRTRPALPGDMVDIYLSHLPEMSFAGACIYQSARGCALPIPLRAQVCVNYYCLPMKALLQAGDEGGPPKGVVVVIRNREHWPFPVGAGRGILKTVLVTGTETVPLD